MGYLTTAAGVPLKVGDVVSLQNLVFVPVLYANGNANFSFQATDGQSYSSVATCVITVNNVNQTPVASISRPSPLWLLEDPLLPSTCWQLIPIKERHTLLQLFLTASSKLQVLLAL